MNLRTQTRLFAHHADAEAALDDLAVAGFTQEEVSLLGPQGGSPAEALVGGLARLLIGSGVEEREATGLAEGLCRGGTLVIIRTDEARSERAGTILANHVAAHAEGSAEAAAGPDGEGSGVLSAPAPGTPGNPPGA